MAGSGRIGSRSPGRLSDGGLPSKIDVGTWVQVDPDALPPKHRESFMRRKRAIQLYLDGASAGEIRRQTGEARTNIYRIIVSRCLQPHGDGDLHGWRGALPHLRVKGYHRHTQPEPAEMGTGAVGSLQWLFSSPEGRVVGFR